MSTLRARANTPRIRPVPIAPGWSPRCPATQRNLEAVRCGYLDALRNVGFVQCYETAPRNWQRSYENGRLYAANVRAAGLNPPLWLEDGPADLVVIGVIREAARRVGDPIPNAVR